jgi:Cu+-exporting ATPase
LRVLTIVIISFLVAPLISDRITSGYQETTVYSCTMHPEVQSSKPRKCPKCGMKLVAQKPPSSSEQKAAASQTPAPGGRTLEVVQQTDEYTCPMHPEIVRNEPGNCPICGMTLEPVNPESAGAVSPELEDMKRRLWIGTALSAPLVLWEMAARAHSAEGTARCFPGNARARPRGWAPRQPATAVRRESG